jgi:hypothetical protein
MNEYPLLANLKLTHPRLIATETAFETLKSRRLTDAILDAFLKRGEIEARAILNVPPLEYEKIGRRLLTVSRTVLRRVILLSMQYHLTGDEALSIRAQEEMLKAASFNDWNPSHFLDTAEMTLALAIGYDWLYDQLDEDALQTISEAIIEKGLKPAFVNSHWTVAENNWNQVCLAGLSFGALALAEREPVIASKILELARDYNHNGMKPYAPCGVYPEGAMYWGYGTTFQTILLDGLNSALETDWGLSKSPGFLETVDSILQMRGPSGDFFNYADGTERPSLEGGNFWFAHFLKRPELVRFEKENLEKYSDPQYAATPTSSVDRTLPLIAFWWPELPQPIEVPFPKAWYGKGITPLASFRTSWDDPDAMFLSLKAGRASQSHGHMDAGSFVFEADGQRWACDLGMQSYHGLESKGIGLWQAGQDGERWSVFRLNNFSHSTITINGQLHRVDGQSEITHFSAGAEAGAIVDLSPVFEGQATRVTRGFAFRGGSHVLIRDEVEGLKAGDTVRFAMVTPAEVAISPDGSVATLTLNGKRLNVTLASSVTSKLEFIPASPPINNYDEPNPNVYIVFADFVAPESGVLTWSVFLQPLNNGNGVINDNLSGIALKQWPQIVIPTNK